MIGYDPKSGNSPNQLSAVEHAFAGAVSGLTTRSVCQPVDVLKIRFQLQLEPISGSNEASTYKGMRQAVTKIVRDEGLGALWKGHIPAQFLSVSYSVTQFVCFELLTKAAWATLPSEATTEWRPSLHFVCGGAAGCFATCFAQPFDVIRTRLVGQGEPKIYRGMYHASRSIYINEGPRALYKGLLPTLIQIAPYSGLQFAFYALLTKTWNTISEISAPASNQTSGWYQSMICGSLAGIGSKFSVYPLDLAKKRLQVQGFEEARRRFGKVGDYSGLADCFIKIVKQEGLVGLYKGFTPSILKAALSSGCAFCFYEQTTKTLRILDFSSLGTR